MKMTSTNKEEENRAPRVTQLAYAKAWGSGDAVVSEVSNVCNRAASATAFKSAGRLF